MHAPNFFIRPSLIWRGGSNIFVGSTREQNKTLWDPGSNPCLNNHFFDSAGVSVQLSHEHMKQGYFV